MSLTRLMLIIAVVALAAGLFGCSSQQSTGGTLPPHYVKGEGYNPK